MIQSLTTLAQSYQRAFRINRVRQWRFEPVRKDGQAVPVMINVEVNFRLY